MVLGFFDSYLISAGAVASFPVIDIGAVSTGKGRKFTGVGNF